jgi:hypothetical protein
MRISIGIFLILLTIISCNKNRCFEPGPPPGPKPCYDSIYFDSAMSLVKTDLDWFYLDLPAGTWKEVGIRWDSEGGEFKYGCDSFGFEYGTMGADVSMINQTQYSIYYEEFEIDGYPAIIDIWYSENSKTNLVRFATKRTEQDKVNIYSLDRDLIYSDLIIKILHSFEYK